MLCQAWLVWIDTALSTSAAVCSNANAITNCPTVSASAKYINTGRPTLVGPVADDTPSTLSTVRSTYFFLFVPFRHLVRWCFCRSAGSAVTADDFSVFGRGYQRKRKSCRPRDRTIWKACLWINWYLNFGVALNCLYV